MVTVVDIMASMSRILPGILCFSFFERPFHMSPHGTQPNFTTFGRDADMKMVIHFFFLGEAFRYNVGSKTAYF